MPQASKWSKPITWDMVNHPNIAGWVSVDVGIANYGIDLNTYNNIDKFFNELLNQHNSGNFEFIGFTIETRKNVDGSVAVRYLPSVTNGYINSPRSPMQKGQFYIYDATATGTMGETTIYLADAFDEPPFIINCVIPVPPRY